MNKMSDVVIRRVFMPYYCLSYGSLYILISFWIVLKHNPIMLSTLHVYLCVVVGDDSQIPAILLTGRPGVQPRGSLVKPAETVCIRD